MCDLKKCEILMNIINKKFRGYVSYKISFNEDADYSDIEFAFEDYFNRIHNCDITYCRIMKLKFLNDDEPVNYYFNGNEIINLTV